MTAGHGRGYFAEFLPPAAAWVPLEVTGARLQARRAEWDTELARAEADAIAVGAALEVLRAECAAQEELLRRLDAGWEGAAAEAARERFVGHLERARVECEAVASVHAAMAEAAEVTRAARAASAELAATLDASDVGGHTPPEVDRMAVGASGPGLALAQACASWLEQVLVPHVQAQSAAFVALCDATADTMAGARQLVADALDGLDGPPASEPGTEVAATGAIDPPPAEPRESEPQPRQPQSAPADDRPHRDPPEPLASVPPEPTAPAQPEPQPLEPQPLEPAPPAPGGLAVAEQPGVSVPDSGAELAEAGPL